MIKTEDWLEDLMALDEDALVKLAVDLAPMMDGIKFIPFEGTQERAYFSEANILLFGGKPGGGKSALLNGLALQEQWRSLLVRKHHAHLRPLVDVCISLVGSAKGFTGIGGGSAKPTYKGEDGRVIHYMGIPDDGLGSLQGEAHDFIGFDEVAQVTEDHVRTIIAWLRKSTGTPDGIRQRVIMASNPPMDSTGDWLVPFYPCWLDDTHPNPAADGELRWFIRENGVDIECKEGDWVSLDGEKVYAQSRTFIQSDYNDNPYLNAQDYLSTLSMITEEKRRILMTGNFLLSRDDADRQMIPTNWIKAAQSRWDANGKRGKPMVSMGVDVTGGGSDETCVSCVYDGLFFDDIVGKSGSSLDSPAKQAALIVELRRNGAVVGMDMGGGYGGGPKQVLSYSGIDVMSFIPQKSIQSKTADGAYGFYNLRSEAYWRMREMLDPNTDGGCVIALPNSKKLLSDLATIKFSIVMKEGRLVIKAESKDEIKKRIRRSPDQGDAAVIALWAYLKGGNLSGNGRENQYGAKRKFGVPKVKVHHAARKERWN